jgi:hypothetical protein
VGGKAKVSWGLRRSSIMSGDSRAPEIKLKIASRMHLMGGIMADLHSGVLPYDEFGEDHKETILARNASNSTGRIALGLSAIWTTSGLAYIAIPDSIWGGCIDVSTARKENPNTHLTSLFQDHRVDIISSHPERIAIFLNEALKIKLQSFYEVDGSVIPRKGIREVYEDHATKNKDENLPKFDPSTLA